MIDLSHIIISNRMKEAIGKLRPETVITSIVEEDGTLPLNRMERMMEASIDELLQIEPVEVTYKRNKNGKKVGKAGKPLFVIINGRHRVSRAIMEGKKEIPVLILDEGDDASKAGKKHKKSNRSKKHHKKAQKKSTSKTKSYKK